MNIYNVLCNVIDYSVDIFLDLGFVHKSLILENIILMNNTFSIKSDLFQGNHLDFYKSFLKDFIPSIYIYNRYNSHLPNENIHLMFDYVSLLIDKNEMNIKKICKINEYIIHLASFIERKQI
tara:strand:+ start:41528 stop:41893 length:366 start_codon:yes stop_codon:yes gene_type:complete